jgi:hypothetical protein
MMGASPRRAGTAHHNEQRPEALDRVRMRIAIDVDARGVMHSPVLVAVPAQ